VAQRRSAAIGITGERRPAAWHVEAWLTSAALKAYRTTQPPSTGSGRDSHPFTATLDSAHPTKKTRGIFRARPKGISRPLFATGGCGPGIADSEQNKKESGIPAGLCDSAFCSRQNL
jgi:hypothetical protein